jgi:hypothetical protein
MGLLRDRSIREVVRHLDLVLPTSSRRETVSGSAIVQARERLGPLPLASLFAQAVAVWGPAAADAERWRGLAVYGVDGTTLRVPDTPENEAVFGRVETRWESTGGYPLLRLVAPAGPRAAADLRGARHVIKLLVFRDERRFRPVAGCGEMPGRVLFRVLRDRGSALFADEPAVAARIRLLSRWSRSCRGTPTRRP